MQLESGMMDRITSSEGENGLGAFPDIAGQLVPSFCISTIISWNADTVTVINHGRLPLLQKVKIWNVTYCTATVI